MSHSRTWTTNLALAGLVVTGCRTAARVAEPEHLGAKAGTEQWVHGSLASRYRGRSGGGDHDSDAYALLSLDVGELEHGAWSGSLVAEARADLDGTRDGSSAFASVGDDDTVNTRLYEAFVDHRGEQALERARFGRQIDYETPLIVTYDGLSLRTRETSARRAVFGFYGGVPARFDSAAQSGDVVLGAFGSLRPWKDARLRADWMHVEDRAYFGHASDDLAALELRQNLGECVDLEGRTSALNGEERDVHASLGYADADGDLVVRASIYRLLETQNELALEFDPFTRVLLEQFPYTQLAFSASKGLGEKARIEAGFDTRRVNDSLDEGPFNRDFERTFVTGILDDVLASAVTASITAERWNSGTDDNDAIGFDLSRKFGAHSRASIGTSYALYRYDLFALEERDHVRTWFVAYRYRRRDDLSWDARFEHEDSFRDYDTVRLGVTWRF